MKSKVALLGPFLQGFFTEYLCNQKRASPQTVASCRDTFRLLVLFLKKQRGAEPATLRVADLDSTTVLAFLDHLEKERGNSIRSRNIRLSAIRSLFRFIALHDPASSGLTTRILAIPRKREDKKLVGYLTREEIDALLAAPDRTRWTGRRDHALLLTMYNSGARVSELSSLQQKQVQFGASSFVQLHGKGRKERTVPLWPNTARVLKDWFRELQNVPEKMAFPNARGTALTRDGVDYLVKQTARKAAAACSTLGSKPVSPHIIRHSTGVHLLQSGVDIAVIALWLGHESIETTHVYVEADLATKEKALQKLAPVETVPHRFRAEDSLLAFLNSL